jgi:hypothetical protein
MDAKSKFREAVRSCNEAADAVVKSDDRSKREVLEQIRALYYRLAKAACKIDAKVKFRQNRATQTKSPAGIRSLRCHISFARHYVGSAPKQS